MENNVKKDWSPKKAYFSRVFIFALASLALLLCAEIVAGTVNLTGKGLGKAVVLTGTAAIGMLFYAYIFVSWDDLTKGAQGSCFAIIECSLALSTLIATVIIADSVSASKVMFVVMSLGGAVIHVVAMWERLRTLSNLTSAAIRDAA